MQGGAPLTFEQLKYFVTIAEALNYSQAAKQLHIAQPALSQSIARLEQEIGYSLFEKKGRGIILTPHGELFLAHAQMAINNIESGMQKLADFDSTIPETVKIAINNDINTDDISEILVHFRQQNQDIDIRTAGMDYVQVIDALNAGKTDFSVCGLNQTIMEDSDLSYIEIASHPFFAYLSADNPLSQLPILDNNIIADETVTVRSSNMKNLIMQICPIRKPESIIITMQEKIILNLIANNSAMYVSDCDFPTVYNGKTICKIPFDCPPRKVILAWNKNKILNKACLKFKKFVKNCTLINK